MSPTSLRRFSLLLVIAGTACAGSSPPPPVASATPTPSGGGDLRPRSSRDAGAPADRAATGGAPVIAGTIALSPGFRVAPTDVLYVMAKKGASTLAVRRIDKPVFPFAFEISGAHSMTGGMAFEGPVDVVARVSRTGDAIPAKGDLEGIAKAVNIPAKGLKLTIDTVRP